MSGIFTKIIDLAKVSIIAFLLFGCQENFRTTEGMIWHTTYHITYDSQTDLNDSILSELMKVDKSVNTFDSTSIVGRINRDERVFIDETFKTVYNESIKINKLSDGMFDPTIGDLITAWGFGPGHKATADTLRIDSLLQSTGITKTRIKDNEIVKDVAGIKFNFSAIAKGYGCDRVADMFARNGVTNYIVEIGGEIRCSGNSPTGKDWRVSVDRPEVADTIMHTSECIISISNTGLATSGNYRNFHRDGGKIYGHTISPKTGRPITTDIISATVLAPTSMEADAWATAFMALGSKRSLELADSLKLPTMLILSDYTILENKTFSALRVLEP